MSALGGSGVSEERAGEMINRLIYAVTALALLSVLVFDETFAANMARDLGEEAAIMLDPWVAGIGGVFLGLLAAAFYRERRR
jgi:precorrin isomerase